MPAEQYLEAKPPDPVPADVGASPPDRPGALRGEVWLTIQTRQAQRLIDGRPQTNDVPGITGLMRFAGLLHQIWAGAKLDDPYADWWLLKVDAALDASNEELHAIRATASARLSSLNAVEVAVARAEHAVRIPLKFQHPYGFRGAYLLAAFDEAARALLTARHVGLMTTLEAEKLLRDASRAVRRAYLSPTGYRFLGITRADIVLETARIVEARALMGEPPPDVVAGEQRPAFAPPTQGGFAAMNRPRRQQNA